MKQPLDILVHFAEDVLKRKAGPETLLAMFDEHGFAPTEFDEGESPKAWAKAVTQRLAAKGRGSFSFFADDLSARFVSVADDTPIRTAIRLSIAAKPSTLERIRDLVVALCELGPVLDGYGHDGPDFELAGDPRFEEPYTVVDLHDAYWLLVLSKQFVAKLGKKHVLATPAFRVVELKSGGAVIFTTESPIDPSSAASRQAQAKALAHLDPEQTVKKNLALYAKRDAALAPAAKDWNPEIAPLYEAIVDEYDGAALQDKIRELNARKLPAVSELRAKPLAENAKPMRFKSRADDLVAILHDKVRKLGATPSSKLLPKLDLHFFREDYPDSYGDEATKQLLEPLGSWLGEVMRLELGGKWVPREKLEENQIVVGKTAYLPFQRVAHFLASKEAAIDYSLTRYFAHAAAVR